MLTYKIQTESIHPDLRGAVHELIADEELYEFIRMCERKPYTDFQYWLATACLSVMSDYEMHGTLGMYPMHLLSEAQWDEVLPRNANKESLLDIGAGQGFVTQKAKNIFSRIAVTETSKSMVRRLAALGFDAHDKDVALEENLFDQGSFDVVSIFNVLDRCRYPRKLLRNSLRFLREDGLALISSPMPFKPDIREFLYRVPKELFPINEAQDWEGQVSAFYESVILESGLSVVGLSRLPYLYKFTKEEPYKALDSVLMVCRKKGELE